MIEFIIFFMCNIHIYVFLMIKNIIYVFLKVKTQYNYKHHFKLGCYIYLFISKLECYFKLEYYNFIYY